MRSPRRPSRWKLVLAPALLLALGACATNPVTGRSELSLVSSNQELALGRDGYPAVVNEYGKYEDAALGAYVDSVGQRVARVSHLPNLEWHFTLVDDPAVNAFAMPGGYIYVTRGILAYLGSEAQLAGVLGHEIGHVTHRHTAEAMTRQQLYGLGLGVLEVAAPSLKPYSAASQQALGLLFLKYSRQNENEADALGVEYATKAGYDPREIPATYETLKRVSAAAGSTIPVFLSTHPDPGDREATTTKLSSAAAAGKTGLVIRQRDYLRHLEGLVYGTDPREGFFEGSMFYHPQMGFQLQFPDGWKTENTRASVSAGEPSGQSVMQLTVVQAGDASPEQYVQQLVTAGKLTAVKGAPEPINTFDAWLGFAIAPGDKGPVTLDLALIRGPGGSMYQLLGESQVAGDANDRKILDAMRTFAKLRDRAKAEVGPARVHLAPAPSAGSLRAMLPQLASSGAKPEDVAIVNGVELDEPIQAGRTLKLIAAGKK